MQHIDGFDPSENDLANRVHRSDLDGLLNGTGLSTADAGGRVSFTAHDPIVGSRLRLAAAIGIPIMACAVGAVAIGRRRGLPAQDLHLDLRQAVHGITPSAFWSPTVAGMPAPSPLTRDNPFLLSPYRTRDGRTVMASGVYPHLAAAWCRFLDVPPDQSRVRDAIAGWDADELESEASAAGLPVTVARTPDEWTTHPQGRALFQRPVIELRRLGDAPVRTFAPSARSMAGVRVLSFTHAIAGPTVGRTLAEHGADVLNITRPEDFEHDFIYDEANIGSRSSYLDLSTDHGRAGADRLLADADVVVQNHRPGSLGRLGLDPSDLARRHPGLVMVSISCYGSTGPWATRPGFDMNASAASGLMTTEGSAAAPALPPTGMINDFVTGYLAAAGATAALLRQADEGGSWSVEVSLTRSAMWCVDLGSVDPALAGTSDCHRLREPRAYDAPTPLGDLHTLAPPVSFSHTEPSWPAPPLVPKGSSAPTWR